MAPKSCIVEIRTDGTSIEPTVMTPVAQPPRTSNASRLQCPTSISRLRVEKIEGGLMVAGVVVAANCQIVLPVFGCLFLFVGCVLTAASYRGPGADEAPDSYAARIAFTGNSRILGPACIVIGVIMVAFGVVLCTLTRRARRKEQRVGFHCPLHGDFYPLSPIMTSKTITIEKDDSRWALCCRRGSRMGTVHIAPPQCPHSHVSSTRSSLSDNSPVSQCPTPLPFLVTSASSVGGGLVPLAAQVSPDQTFGSIRSLSVSRDIASFPLSRTPTPPLIVNSDEKLINSPNISNQASIKSTTSIETAKTANNPATSIIGIHETRKSVSIVLPEEDAG